MQEKGAEGPAAAVGQQANFLLLTNINGEHPLAVAQAALLIPKHIVQIGAVAN